MPVTVGDRITVSAASVNAPERTGTVATVVRHDPVRVEVRWTMVTPPSSRRRMARQASFLRTPLTTGRRAAPPPRNRRGNGRLRPLGGATGDVFGSCSPSASVRASRR